MLFTRAGPTESFHRGAAAPRALVCLHLAELAGTQTKVLQRQRSSHDSWRRTPLQRGAGRRASRGQEKMGLAATGKAEERHSPRTQRSLREGTNRRNARLLRALHSGPERENATHWLPPSSWQSVATRLGDGDTVSRTATGVYGRRETRLQSVAIQASAWHHRNTFCSERSSQRCLTGTFRPPLAGETFAVCVCIPGLCVTASHPVVVKEFLDRLPLVNFVCPQGED